MTTALYGKRPYMDSSVPVVDDLVRHTKRMRLQQQELPVKQKRPAFILVQWTHITRGDIELTETHAVRETYPFARLALGSEEQDFRKPDAPLEDLVSEFFEGGDDEWSRWYLCTEETTCALRELGCSENFCKSMGHHTGNFREAVNAVFVHLGMTPSHADAYMSLLHDMYVKREAFEDVVTVVNQEHAVFPPRHKRFTIGYGDDTIFDVATIRAMRTAIPTESDARAAVQELRARP